MEIIFGWFGVIGTVLAVISLVIAHSKLEPRVREVEIIVEILMETLKMGGETAQETSSHIITLREDIKNNRELLNRLMDLIILLANNKDLLIEHLERIKEEL